MLMSGESYAGVYIPLFAQRIVHEQARDKRQQTTTATAAATTISSSSSISSNSKSSARRLAQHEQQQQGEDQSTVGAAAAARASDVNLVGYMVGNGVTDDFYDSRGQVDFAWGLGLLDPITYHHLQRSCQVGHRVTDGRGDLG